MKLKTMKNLTKGIAIAQAIIAPALMVFGIVKKNKKILNVGMIWCGLIAVDTARTTWNAIDNINSELEIDDDDIFD